MSTGWFYDEQFLSHDTGPGHPERPQRLRAIVDHLEATGLMAALTPAPFEPAGLHTVQHLHDPGYVQRVKKACQQGDSHIDSPDSVICPDSYAAALLAVGAVTAAVDAVIAGRVGNAFCAVRPPGHHAERDRSMGFCLFNNIAIGAHHAVAHHGLSRVAIVDFDVHHGNGTQHLFEDRDDVLFISLHQDPATLYPGTGFSRETGVGEGEGFTLNLPLPPGSGDDVYQRVFASHVAPGLDRYRPQMLFISAGFDAAAADPLAHGQLTPDGFAWMTRRLVDVAKHRCDGRLISVLEGGYDLDSLTRCVENHIKELLA